MKSNYQINEAFFTELASLIDQKAKIKTGTSLYQRELARELEISNASVSRIVNSLTSDMNLSTFLALAKYLDFSENEILYLCNLAMANDKEYKEKENKGIKKKLTK